jgi:hypothetical protein
LWAGEQVSWGIRGGGWNRGAGVEMGDGISLWEGGIRNIDSAVEDRNGINEEEDRGNLLM